jgi:hypothetical protein
MRKATHVPLWPVLFCLLGALCLSGCATTEKSAKSKAKPEIEWQVAPEAKVTQFEQKVGTHEKNPALIFTVAIQNVTSKPMRYRLNIFLLDMDKGSGSLVPVKGKPPVVQPGKTETVKIPFIKTDKESKKMLVVVKEVSY